VRPAQLENRALASFVVALTKVPFAGSHAYLDATADPVELAKLAARFRGPKLVAVATGAISGIDILDIDPRNGGDRWLFEHHDQLPKTRVHETRSIGWHFIFKHSIGLRNSNKLAHGVEFLSTGRWAVWWPEHAGRVLCEGPVAPLPAWLHEKLASQSTQSEQNLTKQKNVPSVTIVGDEEIPKPLYKELMRLMPKATRHELRRARGILWIVTSKRQGDHRNQALHDASCMFRELIYIDAAPRDAAERLLFGAAEVCGYVAKDGAQAAMATIRSGLGSAGLDKTTNGTFFLLDGPL
jgi:hypothetical protein